jgi:cytidylate kinase
VDELITIDGPAGTGKSTVARRVAERFSLPHLDTGAFYRAATLVALRDGADLHSEQEVVQAISGVFLDQIEGRMIVDGEDVSKAIRDPLVTRSVSVVSAHPRVRSALVDQQRAWVELHGGSAVVEGRDIGSVVFPEARSKVFLTATPETRAKRRAAETGEDPNDVLAAINARDRFDSGREASPLIVPDGAVTIDTSDLTAEEVIDAVVASVVGPSF